MTGLPTPRRPLVKVCGLTRPEDVRHAVKSGADLVGFVRHAASPRHVPDEGLDALSQAAGDALAMLVVVGGDPSEIRRVVAGAGLDGVQLCGAEAPGDWADSGLLVLRRIGVADGAQEEIERWRGIASGFVLDDPGSPGGSGRGVDPARAAALAPHGPCLLAGGLSARRLEDGLDPRLLAAPFLGVDASSGLEASRGVKDHGGVQRFIQLGQSLPFPTLPDPADPLASPR